MIDLDAYFARIGYAGSRAPTLATLAAIHALHPAAIPFENIDPLLGEPVPLELEALQAKMVKQRRGGYCFEQNTLLKAVLEAMGFAVTSLAARVAWRLPPDRPPNPRNHMLLQVALGEGAYLADVGFGGLLFSAPLRLAANIEQETRTGRFRLLEDGMFHTLQTVTASGWQDIYTFTLEPQLPIDVLVANWFTATHPASRFRNNLVAERLTEAMRITLFNQRLTKRHLDGTIAEERIMQNAADLARVLADELELQTQAAEALFARLPR